MCSGSIIIKVWCCGQTVETQNLKIMVWENQKSQNVRIFHTSRMLCELLYVLSVSISHAFKCLPAISDIWSELFGPNNERMLTNNYHQPNKRRFFYRNTVHRLPFSENQSAAAWDQFSTSSVANFLALLVLCTFAPARFFSSQTSSGGSVALDSRASQFLIPQLATASHS